MLTNPTSFCIRSCGETTVWCWWLINSTSRSCFVANAIGQTKTECSHTSESLRIVTCLINYPQLRRQREPEQFGGATRTVWNVLRRLQTRRTGSCRAGPGRAEPPWCQPPATADDRATDEPVCGALRPMMIADWMFVVGQDVWPGRRRRREIDELAAVADVLHDCRSNGRENVVGSDVLHAVRRCINTALPSIPLHRLTL